MPFDHTLYIAQSSIVRGGMVLMVAVYGEWASCYMIEGSDGWTNEARDSPGLQETQGRRTEQGASCHHGMMEGIN